MFRLPRLLLLPCAVLLMLWSLGLPATRAQTSAAPPPAESGPTLPPHPTVTVTFERTPLMLALRQLERAAEGKARIVLPANRAVPEFVTGTYEKKPLETVLQSLLHQVRTVYSYRLDKEDTFIVTAGGRLPTRLLWPLYTQVQEDDNAFKEEARHPIPVVQTGHTRSVSWLGFSPDNRLLASAGDDGAVYLWDLNGRRALRTLAGSAGASGFTDGGRYFVSAVGSNLVRWRTATGHAFSRRRNALGGLPISVAIHESGTIVTAANDGSIRAFGVFGKPAHLLVPPGRYFYKVGFNANGGWIYAFLNGINNETPDDRKDASNYRTLALWRNLSYTRVLTLTANTKGRITSAALSPDNRFVILGTSTSDVEIWSIANRGLIKVIKTGGGTINLAIDRANNRLAIASGNGVEIWNMKDSFERAVVLPRVGSCSTLTFRQDGKFLATGTYDGRVSVWDTQSAAQVVAFRAAPEQIDAAFFAPDAKTVTVMGSGRGRVWDVGMTQLPRRLPVAQRLPCVPSPDGLRVAMPGDGGIVLYGTDALRQPVPLHIPDKTSGGSVDVIGFGAHGRLVAAAGWNSRAYVWDTKSGECIAGPLIPSIPKPSASVKSEASLTVFTGRANFVGITGDGASVITHYDSGLLMVWDIATSTVKHRVVGKPPVEKKSEVPTAVKEDVDVVVPAPAEVNPSVPAQDPLSEPAWADFPVNGGGAMAISAFSAKPQYVAVTQNLETLLYSLFDGRLIAHLNGYNPVFDPLGRYVMVTNGDGQVVCDPATGAVTKRLSGIGNNVTYSPDGVLLASTVTVGADSRPYVTVLDNRNLGQIFRLRGHSGPINTLCFSIDNQRLLTGSQDGTTRLWDISLDKPVLNPIQKPGVPMYLRVPERERQMVAFLGITSTADSTDDYAAVAPDGYYMASKGALQAVAFRFGDSTYAFDQFDLQLNRPDILLRRLGSAPPALLKSLETAHRIRLFKMGVTDTAAGDPFASTQNDGVDELQIPAIEWKEGSELPTTVATREVSFAVTTEDPAADLSALLVYVNDVPLFGIRGRDLSPQHTHKVTEQVALKLLPGLNKIQVSSRNRHGLESLRLTQYVVCQAPLPSPRLFVMTVGVSKYKDSAFNLEAADRDARDLAAFFSTLNTPVKPIVPAVPPTLSASVRVTAKGGKGKKGRGSRTAPVPFVRRYTPRPAPFRYYSPTPAVPPSVAPALAPQYGTKYEKIFVRTLTNEQATRDNIRAVAAEFFRDAREEDHIVLFLAGHGTVEHEQYYFATHEIDANNLKDTALPYSELESLLDGTASRQRLVLLDTCQSGDIYVDPKKIKKAVSGAPASVLANAQTQRVGALMRGLPGGVSLTEDDAASLTRDLFADLRRGMGAEVIAAASGVQSALEVQGNGVFTRAMLHVLRNSVAAHRGSLSVSEMRRQVAAEVAKETDNTQTPVMRAESLEFDFPLLLPR